MYVYMNVCVYTWCDPWYGAVNSMYPPPHMTCMYPPPHMTCMCVYTPGATLGKEQSIPCRGAKCLDCVTIALAASQKSVP